jgi:hypothetical protein
MVDPILDSMAKELQQVLLLHGLDPRNPPEGKAPPFSVYQEYQRRGGIGYTFPQEFIQALIIRVGEI